MVNSLELILDEISKAEVKLGKNTGRVALELFEYQEVIELSFNGHNSKPLKYSNQAISAFKRRKKTETSYTLELHCHYRFFIEDE